MDMYEINKINSILEEMQEVTESVDVMDAIQITEDDINSFEKDEKENGLAKPCGPLGEGDAINQFIETVIDNFVEQGFSEEKAQEFVFESMERFIESGELSDTPDVDESDKIKREWIVKFDRLMESQFNAS